MQYRAKDLLLFTLRYISEKYTDIDYFTAIEARYSSNNRRADMLMISDYTHAFEIKSDVDNLNHLLEQLDDYRSTFDFVTVVTTNRHLKKVRKILPTRVGLIIVDKGECVEVRTAIVNKRPLKRNLIAMCSKPVLAKALGIENYTLSLDQMQNKALKDISISEVKALTLKELCRRFKDTYELFIANTSIPYSENDLSLFRQRDRLIIDS